MKILALTLLLLLLTRPLVAFEDCSLKAKKSSEILILIDSDNKVFQNQEFKQIISDYISDLNYFHHYSDILACYLSPSLNPSEVKKSIEVHKKTLKGLLFIGDFKAPKIQSRESRPYAFGQQRPDDTKSFYYYIDFITQYEGVGENLFSCNDCTDQQILNNTDIVFGVIRSFREDVKDIKNYFERIHNFRRKNIKAYESSFSVARSGFDITNTLSLYNDREGNNSSYPEIAKLYNLNYKSSLPFSKHSEYPHIDQVMIDSLKEDVRNLFKSRSEVFVSLMHGNKKYAGGNSDIGPFLNSDIEEQLSGGAAFSVIHSCENGVELSPKSLVYYRSKEEGSSRLAVLAPLDEVYRHAILSNNLVLLYMGFSVGQVAKAMSNQIEMTLFGDPFLKFNDKESSFPAYLNALQATGMVVNPRVIRWAKKLFNDGYNYNEELINLLDSPRASMRAAALYTLPSKVVFELDQNFTMDPHVIVRHVYTSKLFNLGIQGTRFYDQQRSKIPKNKRDQIHQDGLDEKYFFQIDDKIQW